MTGLHRAAAAAAAALITAMHAGRASLPHVDFRLTDVNPFLLFRLIIGRESTARQSLVCIAVYTLCARLCGRRRCRPTLTSPLMFLLAMRPNAQSRYRQKADETLLIILGLDRDEILSSSKPNAAALMVSPSSLQLASASAFIQYSLNSAGAVSS